MYLWMAHAHLKLGWMVYAIDKHELELEND